MKWIIKILSPLLIRLCVEHIILSLHMKLAFLLALLLALSQCLPYLERVALVNALEVGRNEDPMEWKCKHCDSSNKPNKSFVIQNKLRQIKSIVSVYDDKVVLAFRYTYVRTVVNILQDAAYILQKKDEHAPRGCKVQLVMDNMWNSIRLQVLQALKQHLGSKLLIITGVSLGGALSSLSFVDIKMVGGYDKVKVITFGSPRVGNKKWAQWYNNMTTQTRIHIHNDPIPRLPPNCFFKKLCSYENVGKELVCYLREKVCRAETCGKERPAQDHEDEDENAEEFEDQDEDAPSDDQEDEEGWLTKLSDGLTRHIKLYPSIYDFEICT